MFQGIVIDKDETGQQARLQTLDDAQLPAGNVTIRVGYSTLNYKDGLAITGKAPVVRKFPMVPGIDLVGEVEASTHPDYRPGDQAVLNGWGVGETHWGGLAQKARVDGDWLVPLPSAFSPQQAMAIGTAGYTAMLCVMALERHGVRPDDGEIVVTGAAGGWAASPPPSSQAGISRGRSDGRPPMPTTCGSSARRRSSNGRNSAVSASRWARSAGPARSTWRAATCSPTCARPRATAAS